MFISVTRLRIRRLRFMPRFIAMTQGALAQNRRAEGFLGGVLLPDRRLTFWTVTAWRSEADMRAFVLSGSHRAAMPRLLDWADEASVVHWEQADSDLPGWDEAAARMAGEGRPSRIRRPSPDHAALTFAPPKPGSGGMPIRPEP